MGNVTDGAAGSLRAARLRDNAQRMALATLLSPGLRLRPAQIETLVHDFRRTRDGLRGRYAADVRDLPSPIDQIATALIKKSQRTTERDELRRIAEDLVDLQAFVDLEGQPVPLPPIAGEPASPILELIRWRQAGAIAYIREDPSVVGEKVAQHGRWTAIGDAREALKRVGDYRNEQAAGFIALGLFLLAGPAGGVVARLTVVPSFTYTAAILLVVAWLFSPYVGIRASRVTDREGLVLVLIAAVEFAIGFAIVAVTSSLPSP